MKNLKCRVEEKFISLLEKSGQHGVVLNMKCGDVLTITRKGYSPIDKYHWDTWNIIVNKKKLDKDFSYEELISYLSSYRMH